MKAIHTVVEVAIEVAITVAVIIVSKEVAITKGMETGMLEDTTIIISLAIQLEHLDHSLHYPTLAPSIIEEKYLMLLNKEKLHHLNHLEA